MSLRISSSLFFALLLTGCSNASTMPEGTQLECAIGPGAGFERSCLLETVSADEIVIHGPDGGFRRFARVQTGQFEPADGADDLQTMTTGATDEGGLTFIIGDEQYRVPINALPATNDE
jgi:hypothetical protein